MAIKAQHSTFLLYVAFSLIKQLSSIKILLHINTSTTKNYTALDHTPIILYSIKVTQTTSPSFEVSASS
ncbi:hypothetical protein BD408DRAFT_424051 [Parasitella parasitica]|nr:hypothetical protein BD408DRAFT_424051 [Parasitella parasitica]